MIAPWPRTSVPWFWPPSSGAFDVQVAAQTFLGQVYYSGGNFRQGLDVARQAVALLTGE